MDFKKEIAEFITEQAGGITIVAEADGSIVYADSFFQRLYGEDVVGQCGEERFFWLGSCPDLNGDEPAQWEAIDTEFRKYYKVASWRFEKEGNKYCLHRLIDVTEYMELNRDVTKYMSFFKKLSGFQNAVLKKLSSTYYELLPIVADYFKADTVYFLMQRENNIDMITYNKAEKATSNDRLPLHSETERIFDDKAEPVALSRFAEEIREVLILNGSEEGSCFMPLCIGEVSGQKYAIYLALGAKTDQNAMKEPMLLNVVRLYLENGIMREKLIYESEHDSLTGLYNKGKYLAMKEEYAHMDSIGIFNLDVNNLKVMNDTYGHEAGDKLLMKAANSIRKVTNNKVHGYRMGGDEYLMVACDLSEAEVVRIKERWEAELARLNEADDGVHCVIAVGMVYGEKDYDLAALLQKADDLMYEDKKRKKKPGEEIR